MKSLSLVLLCVVLSACGSDTDNLGDPDAATGGSDAGGDGEWKTLISSDWVMPSGQEGYRCERITITEDLYINSLRAISPLGTHHTVLGIDTRGGADGPFSCSANTLAEFAIHGSGVGTADIQFPEGIVIKVLAGQQLLINLHLFNVGDSTLSGTSGTEFKTIAEEDVVHEAEIILMGKTFRLSVPEGVSTQTGGCVMNGDVNLFMVNPHMHQLGTHMKVIAHSTEMGEVVMHDGPYSFEEQLFYPLDPIIPMKAGDRVEVQCTYNNTTGGTIPFGDSSLQEMCFGSTYRYPVRGAQFMTICDEDIAL